MLLPNPIKAQQLLIRFAVSSTPREVFDLDFVQDVPAGSSSGLFLVQPSSSLVLLSYITIPYAKSFDFPDTRRPMMRPKSPNTELKISITKILTNLLTD
jgi:hypothetical protein